LKQKDMTDAQIIRDRQAIRRRAAEVGQDVEQDPLEELAAVRRALGASRRKALGHGVGFLPALARDVTRLAAAVDLAIPDGREYGFAKAGVYRAPVLNAVADIIFALSRTRLNPARLKTFLQRQHPSTR
jgi:alkylhydroperoxidase family enzyme